MGDISFASHHIGGFFDHQILCKKSSDILVLFHGFKGRQNLKLPLLDGCSLMCLSSLQIAGFFYDHYLWNESIYTLDFLHEDNHQGEAAFETINFSGVCAVLSHRIRLQESLIINILGKSQLIS